jgi:hypothetical protein
VSCGWRLKLVKLPPFIMKPEELGKNAMVLITSSLMGILEEKLAEA